MAAIRALYQLLGMNLSDFSKEEKLLFEAELFLQLRNELKNYFRQYYQTYFDALKFSNKKENEMLDYYFMCSIINDILNSKEFTLEGIAYYVDVPEDVIYDIHSGINKNPSNVIYYRLIELHRLVRPELYRHVVTKIAANMQTVA